MNDISFSTMIRDLSKEYYNRRLSLEEYRAQRKTVLDKIDMEYNGAKLETDDDDHQEKKSVFLQTISFFQNNDNDAEK